MVNAKEMALAAAKALDSKKGRDIKVLEIDKITTLADYFVICSGGSNTQINALCGAVEKALKELSTAGILNDGAMVIAEHDAHIAPEDTGALTLYDRRIYRDTALSFYRLRGEE